MSKLSTAALKAMIPTWLATPEARELLKCHSDPSDDASTETERREWLDRNCGWYGAASGSTEEQLEARVWTLWCDPMQWKRIQKHRLKGEWGSYFHQTCGAVMGDDYVYRHGEDECMRHACTEPKVTRLSVDQQGSYDQARADACWADARHAQACWLRVFVPDNDLADNYRLEVITTPEDDAVVGWTIVTD